MYFALLCCLLRMSNILHILSGPIVSRSESHNVVKFIQPEICGDFSISFLCVYSVHFVIFPRRDNTSSVGRITLPPNPLVICWSYAVMSYLGWWFCQHTLYYLSTHVIVSFSSFPSMLAGFFYVYSSNTL